MSKRAIYLVPLSVFLVMAVYFAIGLTKTGAMGCEIILLFGKAREKKRELEARAKREEEQKQKQARRAAEAEAKAAQDEFERARAEEAAADRVLS